MGPIITAGAPAARRRGPLFWGLMIGGLGCVLPLVLLCLGFFGFAMYVGVAGPDLGAVQGNRIRPQTRAEIQKLRLLPDGEAIHWFYSDGVLSAEEGMYFFTDKELVLYSKNWATPEVRIPLSTITDMTFTKSSGWPDDSIVAVEVEGGMVHTFPISSEEGNDTLYYEALEQTVNRAKAP